MRNAVRSRTEAGLKAKSYMDAGELIPDSVVISLVEERLANADTNRGFILDGFPRTVAQASALTSLLAPRALDVVIDLEVPTEMVLARLASRRVCTDCAANYSTSQPPKVAWVCDICGGEVIQRDDDTEAAIRRRLELYERETSPLVAWYAAQGIMTAVDGQGPPDEVAARLVREVDEWRQRRLVESVRQSPAPGVGLPVGAVALPLVGTGDGPVAGAGPGAGGAAAGGPGDAVVAETGRSAVATAGVTGNGSTGARARATGSGADAADAADAGVTG